jgi:hypothetical protein
MMEERARGQLDFPQNLSARHSDAATGLNVTALDLGNAGVGVAQNSQNGIQGQHNNRRPDPIPNTSRASPSMTRPGMV